MSHEEGAPLAEELASEAQLTEWQERFAHYRRPPTRPDLLAWLERFSPNDLTIAHRILDNVTMITETDIHHGYRDGLSALHGWSKKAGEREGRWYFVGVGGAGESGPAMLRMFREANGLASDAWRAFFVSQTDLPKLALSAYDQVVFVDDFAGTGQQMKSYWPVVEELVASEAKCYLLITAVTTDAEREIRENTEFLISASAVLPPAANVFSQECELFSDQEKETLDSYGRIASAKAPRGFGECGLCVVISHKTPNNTLPILHANHNAWVGPFPRYLLPA